MFNRSLLRSRVFQQLYALKVILDGTEASYLDRISEQLVFDPETGVKLEKEDYKKQCHDEIEKFHQYVKLSGSIKKKDQSELSATLYLEYQGDIREEEARAKRNLINSTEEIQLAYFTILDFLAEFSNFAQKLEKEKEANIPRGLKAGNPYKNLYEDQFFQFFVKNSPFLKKGGVNWKKEDDCIRSVFLDCIKNEQQLKDFLIADKPKKQEGKDLLLHLVSERIFKNQAFNAIFEDRFLAWFQERNVVRSMIRKFIKDLDPKNRHVEHIALTGNWEEDKEFFLNLWDVSVGDWVENDVFLSKLAKNWDSDRIALTDKTLIIMGMAEMVHFPGIPIKVTINEYIELSKKYSTPNSKTFVNGVLDKISGNWLKTGKIKKSGRGLLDNK